MIRGRERESLSELEKDRIPASLRVLKRTPWNCKMVEEEEEMKKFHVPEAR